MTDWQPPSGVAIENSKRFRIAAVLANLMITRLEPSAMGGVAVTFSQLGREVVVEFYNNGTAHSLFSDESTEEMVTRPVHNTADEHRAVLAAARKYLTGGDVER